MSASFLAACGLRAVDASTRRGEAAACSLADASAVTSTRTLFVGGLPLDAVDSDLAALFSAFGIVESSPVVLHRGTDRSRGFGFVTFAAPGAATAALNARHELRGKQLALRAAEAHNPDWVRPVRVRRRKRLLSPGVVWLEHFFDDAEQRLLADVALAAGHPEGVVDVTEAGFLAKESERSDFYVPSYAAEGDRTGAGVARELKLFMCTLGRHWDVRTGRYESTRTDHDNKPVAPLPTELLAAAQRALVAARHVLVDAADGDEAAGAWARADFDIGIVNAYDRAGRLGLHQDTDESSESIAAGTPVVSLSFGDTALFEFVEMETLRAHEAARHVDGRSAAAGAHLGASELEALPRKTVKLGSGDVLVFGGESRLVYHGVSKIIPHSCQTRPWNSHGLKRGRLNVTLRQF